MMCERFELTSAISVSSSNNVLVDRVSQVIQTRNRRFFFLFDFKSKQKTGFRENWFDLCVNRVLLRLNGGQVKIILLLLFCVRRDERGQAISINSGVKRLE